MAEPNTTEIDKPKDYSQEQPVYCQFPNRLAFTGIILDCLRQLFSNANNILHPQIKDFFWAPEATTDPLKGPYQLVIEDAFNFDLSQALLRPAILVKSGNWQETKLAIGDNGGSGNTYHKRIAGQHTILIAAKSIAQAELLAREVHGYLSHFGPLLREWIDLVKWEVPVIQQPERLEEQTENIVISVGVAYEMLYAWDLQPEPARLLRQIVVNVIMNPTN